MITYRELGEAIARMNAEQLEMNVTIHLQSVDEFFQVDHCELNDAEQEDDRLDDGHPVLIVFDGEPEFTVVQVHRDDRFLEYKMQLAFDTKKEFAFSKDQGTWSWSNRGEAESHGFFPLFLLALDDAVAPYLEDDGTNGQDRESYSDDQDRDNYQS